MTIALLPLMSYERIGQAAHEWIGISMFVLFVAHQIGLDEHKSCLSLLNASVSVGMVKGIFVLSFVLK